MANIELFTNEHMVFNSIDVFGPNRRPQVLGNGELVEMC